jgi:hypothetical protein
LVGHGQAIASALSGGFHLAWAIAAGLGFVCLLIAAMVLRSEGAAEVEAPVEVEEIPA